MKKLLVILLLLTKLACLAQESNRQFTEAGKDVSIIPPAGFVPSPSFKGFQNEDGSGMLLFMDLPAAYEQTAPGLTAENLAKQRMKLLSKEEVEINGGKGLLLKCSQFANGQDYGKWMACFGNGTKTIIVTGIYPLKNKLLETALKSALLTVKADLNTIAREEDVPFSINTIGTKFKFATSISGMLLYNTSGSIPSSSPVFTVGKSLGVLKPDDREAYTIQRFGKLPHTDKKIEKINPITINGISGYEVVGKAVNTNKVNKAVYLVMLYSEDGYYILTGLTTNEKEVSIADFKALAQTFTSR